MKTLFNLKEEIKKSINNGLKKEKKLQPIKDYHLVDQFQIRLTEIKIELQQYSIV